MSVLFIKQRSSVSETPFGGLILRCKDRSRLPMGYNWTFFASPYTAEAFTSEHTSKSAFLEGGGSFLGLNIRLKGCVYRQHLYTIR